MFNVIIYADKDFDNYELLKSKCDFLLSRKNKEEINILSAGECDLVERYAKESELPITTINADWKNKGNRAGYLRNKNLTELGNAAIIFSGSYCENKGVAPLSRMAQEKHLLVRLIKEEDDDEQ